MVKKLREYFGSPNILCLLIFSGVSLLSFSIVYFTFGVIQDAIIHGNTIVSEGGFLRYTQKKNIFDMLFYSLIRFPFIYIFGITLVLSILLYKLSLNSMYNNLKSKCETMINKNIDNKPINKNLTRFKSKTAQLFSIGILTFVLLLIYFFALCNNGYDVNGHIVINNEIDRNAVTAELNNRFKSRLEEEFAYFTGKLKDDRISYELLVNDDQYKLVGSSSFNIVKISDLIPLTITLAILLWCLYLTFVSANRRGGYCPICHKKEGIPEYGTVINVENINTVYSRNETEVERWRSKPDWSRSDSWIINEKDVEVENIYNSKGTIKTYEHICSNCGQKFQYKIKDISTKKIDSRKV